jgi:hypothetical protein
MDIWRSIGMYYRTTAAVVLDLKGDPIALAKLHTLGERGDVDEDIAVAIIPRDEAEAAIMIEELHCAVDRNFPSYELRGNPVFDRAALVSREWRAVMNR